MSSLPQRVLVIDDNTDLANMFAMLLEASGYVTRTAYSGHEGLEAVPAFMPDVVICDIGMPDMSGHDVAKRIRDGAYGCEPMLIAVSGWGDARTVAASSAAGFVVHMTKPVAIEAVLEVIRDRCTPA